MNAAGPGPRTGRRSKVTIRQMMIAVAVVAAFLPALRGDPDGERLAGALIVGTSVLALASKIASNSITWNRSAGIAVTRWRKIWIWLGSLATALLFIGAADFLFLFLYIFVGALISPHLLHYRIDPIWILVSGLSTVIAVILLRRAIQHEWEAKTRPPPPDEFRDRVDPDHRP